MKKIIQGCRSTKHKKGPKESQSSTPTRAYACMHECTFAVGGLRGHGPRGKHFNNVVHSKSDICHHLMNTHVLVFTYLLERGYGNEWRQDGEKEGTEKERGREEEMNQGTNGVMEQNKDGEALRYERDKFLGVTPC